MVHKIRIDIRELNIVLSKYHLHKFCLTYDARFLQCSRSVAHVEEAHSPSVNEPLVKLNRNKTRFSNSCIKKQSIFCNVIFHHDEVILLSKEKQEQHEDNMADLVQLKHDLQIQLDLAGDNQRKINVKVNPIKAEISEIEPENRALEFEASQLQTEAVSNSTSIFIIALFFVQSQFQFCIETVYVCMQIKFLPEDKQESYRTNLCSSSHSEFSA